MLVGEQPGGEEDRVGLPFLGPCGRVLDDALHDSGLARDDVYVTNALKHAGSARRGSQNARTKPSAADVLACRRWLESELEAIGPCAVVALGATAGSALVGAAYRVASHHGLPVARTIGAWSGPALGTLHPSAVLRAPTSDAKIARYRTLVEDFRTVAELCEGRSSGRQLAS